MAARTFLIFLSVIVSCVVSSSSQWDDGNPDSLDDYSSFLRELYDPIGGGVEESAPIRTFPPSTTCTNNSPPSASIRPNYELNVALVKEENSVVSLSSKFVAPAVILPPALTSLGDTLSADLMTPADTLSSMSLAKMVMASEPSSITEKLLDSEAGVKTTVDEYDELLKESGLLSTPRKTTTTPKRVTNTPVPVEITVKTTTTTVLTQSTSVVHPIAVKESEVVPSSSPAVSRTNSSPISDPTLTESAKPMFSSSKTFTLTSSSTASAKSFTSITNSAMVETTTLMNSTSTTFSLTSPSEVSTALAGSTVVEKTTRISSSSRAFILTNPSTLSLTDPTVVNSSSTTFPTSPTLPRRVRYLHLSEMFDGLPYPRVSKPIAVIFLIIPGVMLLVVLIAARIYSFTVTLLFVLRR